MVNKNKNMAHCPNCSERVVKAPFCAQCGKRWYPAPKHLMPLVDLYEEMRQREHNALRECKSLQKYLDAAIRGKSRDFNGKLVNIPVHARQAALESRQHQMSFPKERYELWHARAETLLKLLKKEGFNKPPKAAEKKATKKRGK